MKDKLVRFGVSMEESLLGEFDALISRRGYGNRSEAIRDLVRSELVKDSWESSSGRQTAVLGLVYEHEHGNLMHKIMHLQHDHEDLIVSSQHVHLDHDNCMEVLILRGNVGEIESLSQNLISIKGVKYGQLMRGAGEKYGNTK